MLVGGVVCAVLYSWGSLAWKTCVGLAVLDATRLLHIRGLYAFLSQIRPSCYDVRMVQLIDFSEPLRVSCRVACVTQC